MAHFYVSPCSFRLDCSWLSPHDALYLVGSIPILGTWQPQAGIRLRTSEVEFPCWRTQAILPCDVEIHYKYVAVRGQEIVWEQSANRLLRLKSHSFEFFQINDGNFGDGAPSCVNAPQHVQSSFDNRKRVSPRRISSREKLATSPQSTPRGFSDTISEESEDDLSTIFVVDRELPFECVKGSDGGWILTPKEQTASSRLSYLRRPCEGEKLYAVKYIGSPGFYVPECDQSSLAAALLEVHCFPVFMQSEAQDSSYKKYISSVLLPSFASVYAPASSITARDDEVSSKLWKEYVQVNKLFASVFCASAHGGKTSSYAWVLGYELLLVPQYIRQAIKYEKYSENKIIFWLLQPFPPSDTFRALQQRLPFLQSILAADLVEFDSFDYCRHFMHCCRRLLNAACMNIEGGFLGIEHDNRVVFLRSSPSGVLSAQLNEVLRSSQFQQHRTSFLRLTQDCQCVLVSYDSYDRLAGILLKLIAWKSFLDELSSNHKKTYKLVLMCVDSRQVLSGHDEYKVQVQSYVTEIQQKHPNSLLFISEDSCGVSFARKLALFSVGDVLVNSYVRQGVDPSPLEYILVNDHIRNPDHPENPMKPASIIISEFTSYSRLLSRAQRINPWDTKSFVTALDRSISMATATRLINHSKHMENIQSLDFVRWARSVITDTVQSVGHDKVNLPSTSLLTPTLFSTADVNSLASNFSASRSRFISVVWDRFCNSKYAREIAENLIRLSRDACNVVCILCSGSRHELETHFPASLCTALSFFCEFGVLEKARGSADKWTNLHQSSRDFAWKAQAMRIMNQYSGRTDGSLPPRATECSITWDYSHVDPELAAIQVLLLGTFFLCFHLRLI